MHVGQPVVATLEREHLVGRRGPQAGDDGQLFGEDLEALRVRVDEARRALSGYREGNG